MNNLRTVIDQIGREVTFSFPPKRIVSLVPSQTEFLLDIGAPVIGRTKFCIHPADKVWRIRIIGGTKNFQPDSIKKLKPDLIIGNKEENHKEGIEALSVDYPVWMSDIYDLDDAFAMMTTLGILCDLEDQANSLVDQCRLAMMKVKSSHLGKVIYLIWKNPWMAAGSNTFIDHILNHIGYENLITKERYPDLTYNEIATLNPDAILLSSEPYPFREEDVFIAKSKWPGVSCRLIDGALFSWYGSRLKHWLP